MNRSLRALVASCVFAIPALFGAASAARCETKDLNGLPNFGAVSATLYRGAQPTAEGFKSLQHMGVGMVVNFRETSADTAREQHEVEALGMKYVAIPWSGHEWPSDAQIVQFLDLVRANPQTKIFVHCLAGADRTGTMVAAYRIAMEHQSTQDAVKEMHSYHYHHFFLPQLERYVEGLPHLLTASTLFAAYMPTPTASAASVAPPAVATTIAAPLLAGAVVQ